MYGSVLIALLTVCFQLSDNALHTVSVKHHIKTSDFMDKIVLTHSVWLVSIATLTPAAKCCSFTVFKLTMY